MQLLEIARELLDAVGAPGPAAAAIGAADRAVEPFHPVIEQIEPRDIVLDLIDALQIGIEHLQRFLKLVETAGDGDGASAAGHHEVAGGHDGVKGGAGDHPRDHVDARMQDEPGGKGRGGDGHGDQDDHVKQKHPSRISIRGHRSESRPPRSRFGAPR